MKISIEKTKTPKPKPDAQNLGFGVHFSDHIFLMDWKLGRGWHEPRIVPFQDLHFSPAASVLHYGQALFEGMKAFRSDDGRACLFRPEFNFERMNRGAEALCMPLLDREIFFESLHELIRVEDDWIPQVPNSALYIRPTLIGNEGFLGVRPSQSCLYMVILSPVGAYYKEGVNPIKIWVETDYVRAAPGGLGAVKAGANYAASLKAAMLAKEKGYAQVLWLDARERKFVEEVGTMNVFFVLDGRVVTPELNDSILAGCTRDSCLQLLREWNVPVEERKVSIQEILEAHKNGKLTEAFGTGTAAVITPIGELSYLGQKMTLNDFKTGPLAARLFNEISGVQRGKISDHHKWIHKIPL